MRCGGDVAPAHVSVSTAASTNTNQTAAIVDG
jgi:hypothetical protein